MKSIQNKLLLITVAIIFAFGFIIYYLYNKNIEGKDKYETEVKLKNALIDTIKTYKNKNGELVSEKLTLQSDFNELKGMYGKLTKSQQELLNRISEVEKSNSIIAAALVETNVELKNLGVVVGNVNSNDSSIMFNDSTKYLNFNIKVNHVKPIISGISPTLEFNKFELPNKQFIEFHWKDDKKSGYPIAFSVSNSNQYFKTANVNSYAIPNLKKSDLDPNTWQKFTKWVDKKGKFLITVGVAGAAGAGATLLLFK